jgi:phosphatidylethanolamine-binding protein (PEBP) family uncharacterized protein
MPRKTRKNRTRRRRLRKTRANVRTWKGGQNSLVVRYGEVMVRGQKLTKESTQQAPVVQFTPVQGTYYTLIMWDPDVPGAIQPGFLHWLATNLTTPRDIALHSAVPYYGPHPPSGTHRYFFGLFEQLHPILPTNLPRQHYDIDQFVQKNLLREVARVYMKVSATSFNE